MDYPKFEIGQVWETREGKHLIVEWVAGNNDLVFNDKSHRWGANTDEWPQAWGRNAADITQPTDLYALIKNDKRVWTLDEEWLTEEPEITPWQPGEPFQVGKHYRTRDGGFTTITEIDTVVAHTTRRSIFRGDYRNGDFNWAGKCNGVEEHAEDIIPNDNQPKLEEDQQRKAFYADLAIF